MKRIEFQAMGSRMLALLDSNAAQADETLARLPAWFEEWEQVLSRFRPGNELDRLNRSGGRPMAVSQTLWEVFQAATTAEKFTGGLVAPTVLDALVSAGYDRSFESMPAIQMGSSFATPAYAGPSGVIVWDAPTRSLVLPDSVHLDLGGIAKGWAADQALRRLSHLGPALVAAGGDIAISGLKNDGQAWPIGVDDPFTIGAHFETLKLARCGVATSGRDYHRWLKDGIWYHHIIDPRTGLPADTDVISATVVAPTVMEAEAAAKAVLILGSQAGLDWLEADSGLAGVLVLENASRIYSRNMENFLWRNE
jgi:thiamine biosynthesis lipoprotein